jgi:hypothetical protein
MRLESVDRTSSVRRAKIDWVLHRRHVKLIPFQTVDDVPFSSTEADILRMHGHPMRRRRNEVELNELDYGGVVFRFQDSGRLEEVTMQAEVLHLGAVAVPFANLEAFVQGQDPGAFYRARFLVSPAFGFAFDPREPSWVTALARHAIAQWHAL